MLLRGLYKPIRLICMSVTCACLFLPGQMAMASQSRGLVVFNGLPVPGATVTATHDTIKVSTITDAIGSYGFNDLTDGTWTVSVAMQCFETSTKDVTVSATAAAERWEIKLLPLDAIEAQANVQVPVIVAPAVPSESAQTSSKSNAQSAQKSSDVKPVAPKPSDDNDGLLINGSSNNAASSPFALAEAFGNMRNGGRGLYTGGIGVIIDNSALDARPYSISGLETAKPAYSQFTGQLTLGGPIRIPHLLRRGPNFFAGYVWRRDSDSSALPGLVPDAAERAGDFSGTQNSAGQPIQIFDPVTGLPFTNNQVPVSPQAEALLALYPLPNVAGNSAYNYQIPVLSGNHQDALQTRLDKDIGHRDEVFGKFAFESTRSDSSNLFGFTDKTSVLGLKSDINWSHRFGREMLLKTEYTFSRLRTDVTPYFANRTNVSGAAGITGNDQDPINWGPPALSFSSGVVGLSDEISSRDRNETNGLAVSANFDKMRHYWTFGGDFRREEFNYLAQQNPRGAFAFTGAATQSMVNGVATGGSDFADFLLGVPDTSSLAFGNADKYFRESVYDAYVTDDFRVNPELTINAGVRWEYGAPITELFDRLVNLDATANFAAVAPVLASDPTGSLTGEKYPSSLIRPDKSIVEPRIGLSWRPLPGSSIVVRAGYGIYSDTSVYQTTALALAQQSPLSKSLSVENSASCPLTLANGFMACSTTTQNTFAVDPNFRVGTAQNWQASVQTDLPQALQLTATYVGIKGTHGVQQFLPNTYPIGAVSPCADCPVGFTYRTSGGNSIREAGMVQLRRRLRDGFTASLQYTYSKSIDDDAQLGGAGPVGSDASAGASAPTAVIAQNWLDLRAERGLSTFDQRHLLSVQAQYTSGMGLHGGTLLKGWRGTLLKQWTVLTKITAGTGLPETPIYLAAVPGTGVTGSIRPDVTGASIHAVPSGLNLNPAAYTAPATGTWGTAGRNSITGPNEFSLNASLARSFRVKARYNLDLRVDSTNLLNHAVFSSWNTTINNTQFGLPVSANAMRSLEATMRLRF